MNEPKVADKQRPGSPEHGASWHVKYCITCDRWIWADAFTPHEVIHREILPPQKHR